MLNRLRLRLMVMNAAVFLAILCCLAVLLALYMRQHVILDSVDPTLEGVWSKLMRVPDLPGALLKVQSLAPGTVFLVWTGGKVPEQVPRDAFDTASVRRLKELPVTGAPETLNLQGHTWRVAAHTWTGASPPATLDIALNIDSPNDFLRALDTLLLFGVILGALLAVAAGDYLARRALVPIARAWARQQEFVADASHELRTPLSVVRARAEALLAHPASAVADEADAVVAIDREAAAMTRLVDRLLTLARADSNQVELATKTIDLAALTRQVADDFRPLFPGGQIAVGGSNAGAVFFHGDPDRMRQLLVILLDNAVTFTPKGGTITLGLTPQRHRLELTVTDTGSGIAESDIPRVFDRFFRSGAHRDRRRAGAGLGLAIARWIVEAHGGHISLASQLGRGTVVTVTLPRGGREHPPDPHADV